MKNFCPFQTPDSRVRGNDHTTVSWSRSMLVLMDFVSGPCRSEQTAFRFARFSHYGLLITMNSLDENIPRLHRRVAIPSSRKRTSRFVPCTGWNSSLVLRFLYTDYTKAFSILMNHLPPLQQLKGIYRTNSYRVL
jgi:hypothetical protein